LKSRGKLAIAVTSSPLARRAEGHRKMKILVVSARPAKHRH
jgi:hypothetical protein